MIDATTRWTWAILRAVVVPFLAGVLATRLPS